MHKSTRKTAVKKMIKNGKKNKPNKPNKPKRGQRTATNKKRTKK